MASNHLMHEARTDDAGLHGRVLGGQTFFPWTDLRRVAVRTTSGGPFLDDVFFLLTFAGDNSVAIPQDEAGDDILRRLQQLDGFDNEAVIHAMGSTDDAEFVCWTAPGA